MADKKHLTIGFSGLLLWNRLIWLTVGLLIFGLNTYLSDNSDWVEVRTTISTSPDQISIAPGSL